MSREIAFHQALSEAVALMMEADDRVFIFGEGVPDPKTIFGSTAGLKERFGEERVFDTPLSENGLTGIAIGAALAGMRPVMTHQRIDFALLAMDQIVNHAAKRCYTSGGKQGVPVTIRSIIGRGWGQGSQHSQSLHAFFAHIPGLKVVMPVTPHDAKGLLIASIEDNNPVMFIEHRWLYNVIGHVPEGIYRTPLGPGKLFREGKDVTIVAISYMVMEALRAAEMLAKEGLEAEVLAVQTLRPVDDSMILDSVRKTLRAAPRRVALPDCPTPTTPALANHYYPRAIHVANVVAEMADLPAETTLLETPTTVPLDVPDKNFPGPF